MVQQQRAQQQLTQQHQQQQQQHHVQHQQYSSPTVFGLGNLSHSQQSGSAREGQQYGGRGGGSEGRAVGTGASESIQVAHAAAAAAKAGSPHAGEEVPSCRLPGLCLPIRIAIVSSYSAVILEGAIQTMHSLVPLDL